MFDRIRMVYRVDTNTYERIIQIHGGEVESIMDLQKNHNSPGEKSLLIYFKSTLVNSIGYSLVGKGLNIY